MERFYLCTRSVMVLFGNDTDNEALEIAAKSKYIESSCLFPNLRSLTWISGACSDHWNVNPLLLSPTLVKLVIPGNPDWVHPSCGPWTKWIDHRPRSADVCAKPSHETSLANSIPLLKSLRNLSILDSIVTDSLLKGLGTLPRFQALTITSANYDGDDEFRIIRIKGLEKEVDNLLKINEGVASSWTSFQFCDLPDNRPKFIQLFESHRFPFLTHLTIKRGGAGIIDGLGRLIKAIAESALSLESLVVGPSQPDIRPHVEWSTLSPILTCKNLIRFEVYSWRIAMTAMELKEFAESRTTWVSVTILPVAPFNGVDIWVFRHCPNFRM